MDFKAARQLGEARMSGPRAVSARYDQAAGRLRIVLTDGTELVLLPSDVQGLEKAAPVNHEEIELEPFGLALHFPRLDADLLVLPLSQGVLGSAEWMSARDGGRAAPGDGSVR
ncbi:DUF2442 domain-containing protein [Xanthobacter sp. DSM 14520]|uniref:DUF2442 domain-containing protein n=1 Tax=Xanthobacter autotrophicus (strain ATCC BAA-1158 / Py2) TaxID=78245 RepID=UPI0037281E33